MIYIIHEIHYKSPKPEDVSSDLNTLCFSHQGTHYEVSFRQILDAYMGTYGKESDIPSNSGQEEKE